MSIMLQYHPGFNTLLFCVLMSAYMHCFAQVRQGYLKTASIDSGHLTKSCVGDTSIQALHNMISQTQTPISIFFLIFIVFILFFFSPSTCFPALIVEGTTSSLRGPSTPIPLDIAFWTFPRTIQHQPIFTCILRSQVQQHSQCENPLGGLVK